MGVGSFDVDFGSLFVAGDAMAVGVFRYEGGRFSIVPNVRCLGIDLREGCDPPTARFCYVTDDILDINLGWPSQFQDLWPMDAGGPYVVRDDDRLVVATPNPDGTPDILFDGFAQVPQVDVSGEGQAVTFTAVNVATRAFDVPISGRTQRDASTAGSADRTGGSDIRIDLPCRFNPAHTGTLGGTGGFLPNCCNDAFESPAPDGEGTHPVFLDPLCPFGNLGSGPVYWTVGKAIRYILATNNASQTWVTHPNLITLDSSLYGYSPADGHESMGPSDPNSYVTAPVTIRDYDATNKPWPRVVSDLLGYAGFFMRWETGSGSDGLPETFLRIYRRDEFSFSPKKRVYLDQGVVVGESPNNLAGIRLARASDQIVNAFKVETGQRQVEISIVILPLFQPTPGDEAPASRGNFAVSNRTASTSATVRRKYRWYGADELGEGHYGIADDGTGVWRTTPCDFRVGTAADAPYLFPADDNGDTTFVYRYRPGHRTLISRDSTGRPLKATLQMLLPRSKDKGPVATKDPALIDVTQDVLAKDFRLFDIPDGWRLLPDRLGIEVTVDDPEQWATGESSDGTNPKLMHIQGISWWSNPGLAKTADGPTFGAIPLLILTTVVDDDLMLNVEATPRFVSPTRFARWRVIDARDHFRHTSVDPGSRYYRGNGQDPAVVRDDTDVAQAHANQLRSKHEFPHVTGTLTIPYITPYYNVGDQISRISGRGVNLQSNIGVGSGEEPVFPWVVGISWGFENDRQTTTLILSDKRADINNSW
jgi:hypothetical protein